MKGIVVLFFTCFLLVSCSGGESIDFTNKTNEQLCTDIKKLNDRIKRVSIMPTDTGAAVVIIDYLAEPSKSAILNEGARIKDILKAISTGKGTNPLIGVNIMLLEPGADKLGNKAEVLSVTLGWHSETLHKVNWNNIQDWQILGLSTILERGPFGNNAIVAYCKDGATSFGEDFCKNAGYR